MLVVLNKQEKNYIETLIRSHIVAMEKEIDLGVRNGVRRDQFNQKYTTIERLKRLKVKFETNKRRKHGREDKNYRH